jgi:serine/threonine protein kinase
VSMTADRWIGTELAGYRIESLIGRGGMSTVYRAEDLTLGRKVALKLISPELLEDEEFRERFRAEWRLAASIDHPNVIPIYEAGDYDETLFIAMRYVEGTDLKKRIAEEGGLEPERAVNLVSQVAEGLDAAHNRGLVHRDVKPSNVLIAREGEKEHAYLADFGLTKPASTESSARESIALSGSYGYVSPEQITDGTAGAAEPMLDHLLQLLGFPPLFGKSTVRPAAPR